MAVLGVYTGCHVSLHNVNDIEGRPSDFVNNVLPTLRDIFVSASIARNISRLKLGQVNNTKFKSTRSFNGEFFLGVFCLIWSQLCIKTWRQTHP